MNLPTKTNYLLRVSLTMPKGKKHNQKTGPIPVSTTTAKTCPLSCPFNNKNGCYAESGPLAIHWRKVTSGERGTSWEEFCKQIESLPKGQLFRHNQAGDLPSNSSGHIVESLVDRLVYANRGKRGFTYTHHNPKKGINSEIIAHANRNGFTINLSGNNLAHADELKSLNIAPVVTVLPNTVEGDKTKTLTTPAGNKVVVCPATYREDVTCSTCKLCQRADRSCIIGFPAHGAMKNKATKVSTEFSG